MWQPCVFSVMLEEFSQDCRVMRQTRHERRHIRGNAEELLKLLHALGRRQFSDCVDSIGIWLDAVGGVHQPKEWNLVCFDDALPRVEHEPILLRYLHEVHEVIVMFFLGATSSAMPVQPGHFFKMENVL